MQFTKPPKTFDEQVDLLMARGMEIGDLERAKRYLAHINYYGSSLSTVGKLIFHEGRLKRSLPVIK